VSPRTVPDGITHGHGISRTLAALEVLAEGSITAAALGEQIAVDTRTARRLLQRLAVDGYVARGSHNLDGFASETALRELGARLSSAATAHAEKSHRSSAPPAAQRHMSRP
jgi:DNA-binding IclR family transcriptional regulator